MFLFLSLKPLSIHLLHLFFFNRFVIVKNSCCSSVTKLCPTLGNLINCSTPGFSVHDCLPEFAQTHVHWVSDAIQPSHPLLSPSPPAFIFPSIRVFSNESILSNRWPNYWSFTFSINPSYEYSELISFRTDWLDLLAIQGILKSLLQHHSSETSILRHSAFFIVQLSHPYMTVCLCFLVHCLGWS